MEIKGPVWLIDSCAVRRAGLQRALALRGVKVGVFADPTEFLVSRPVCGLVLVHDASDSIRSLKAALGQSSSGYLQIAYSHAPDWRRAASAMRSGALDYFEAEGDPDEIVAKIISVQIANEGKAHVSASQDVEQEIFPGLTKRERQVLDRVIAGMTNRAIAEALDISFRTVEIHRSNMLRKIGARNTADAVRLAYEAKVGRKNSATSIELPVDTETLHNTPTLAPAENSIFFR